MWDYKVWISQGLETFLSTEDAESYLESMLNLDGVQGWELTATSVVELKGEQSIIYHFKKPAEDS